MSLGVSSFPPNVNEGGGSIGIQDSATTFYLSIPFQSSKPIITPALNLDFPVSLGIQCTISTSWSDLDHIVVSGSYQVI